MAGGYRAARSPVIMKMKPWEHLCHLASPSVWGRANNEEFWWFSSHINRLMLNLDILSNKQWSLVMHEHVERCFERNNGYHMYFLSTWCSNHRAITAIGLVLRFNRLHQREETTGECVHILGVRLSLWVMLTGIAIIHHYYNYHYYNYYYYY